MTPSPPVTRARPRLERIRYLDGQKLLAQRLGAGLSQRELAIKAGGSFTQSHVSQLERGLHSALLPTVGALAGALGIPPAALMPDDLLARIEGGDPGILRRLAARGVVIEIPGRPPARPVCSACTASWSDGHKCQKAGHAA